MKRVIAIVIMSMILNIPVMASEEKIFENVWVTSYSNLEGVRITIEGPIRWIPIIGVLIYIKKLKFEYYSFGNTVIRNMEGEKIFNISGKHVITMENVSFGFFRMLFPLILPLFLPILITHAQRVVIGY